MLLEFSIENFKSFSAETRFSMYAAPKQKGLDYSLFKIPFPKTNAKGLCSSVIYGPNAAGKTNIIGAMDVFRSIVLRGNIKNAEENSSANPAASLLELIPNSQLHTDEPVRFYIDFYEENLWIQYQLIIDLGQFLDKNHPRKILFEKLTVNHASVFERNEFDSIRPILSVRPSSDIAHLFSIASKLDLQDTELLASESLDPQELFLCNGFKAIFSRKLSNIITDWFSNKFMVIYRADSMQLINRFSNSQKQSIYVVKTTTEAARTFGINSNAIGYIIRDTDSEPQLCSILSDQTDSQRAVLPAELFESYGTIRFINLFPLIIQAIKTGATLIVDEFDASIHPMALMSIINIFHNDEINKHHAQLIFNTHNPIFLNSNLLRRDEIKFVERDDETHSSTLYALSDFGTSGDKGVRRHEDYMKNYFVSRYGAISDIDFTPIFEEVMASESEDTHAQTKAK